MNIFDFYGSRASDQSLTSTEASGRYRIQAEGLRWAVRDIQNKLALHPGDRFLDIGCGVGDVTIPLSLQVASTACVDHPDVIKRLQKRIPQEEIHYFPGNFLEIDIPLRFEKILAYGVLICLADTAEVFAFIDKAVSLLEPGGRFLAGDFVNRDKKQRFLSSDAGKKFSQQWAILMEGESRGQASAQQAAPEGVFGVIDDAFLLDIIRHYRRAGHEVYLLPQPPELAFGNTREDLLIVKHC
jgi:cyclopropane fatty-acyl-phospholipid synthase-like methyltransferase